MVMMHARESDRAADELKKGDQRRGLRNEMLIPVSKLALCNDNLEYNTVRISADYKIIEET